MIRYTMFETQISEGHHTSCHFCFDKFDGSLDRGLDLSKYELDKKLIYQEIHFKLEKGIITLEEAQKMWLKKVKQLKKEEAK